MKQIIILLLICSTATAQIPTDKKYHAGAGVVIGVWGTFAGNALDLTPEKSALFGLGAVTVAGLGKELWDEIDYGGWDWADFGYTMAGGAISTMLVYTGLKIFKKTTPYIGSIQGVPTIGLKIKI